MFRSPVFKAAHDYLSDFPVVDMDGATCITPFCALRDNNITGDSLLFLVMLFPYLVGLWVWLPIYFIYCAQEHKTRDNK
jgi:hypothetical protein